MNASKTPWADLEARGELKPWHAHMPALEARDRERAYQETLAGHRHVIEIGHAWLARQSGPGRTPEGIAAAHAEIAGARRGLKIAHGKRFRETHDLTPADFRSKHWQTLFVLTYGAEVKA